MTEPFGARALRDFDRLTPLTDALAALLSVIKPVIPSRRLLREALGSIAAESIRSSIAHPPGRIATRDGYVIMSRETIGATPYAPAYMAGALRAVYAGEALPEEGDAILPPEAVAFGSTGVEVLQSVFPGSGIRYPGDDIGIGDRIIAAGERLRPDRLVVMRLAGIQNLLVRSPRIGVEGSETLCGMIAALASETGASLADCAEADVTVAVVAPGYAASAAAVHRFTEHGRLIAHGLAVNPGSSTAILTVPRNDGQLRIVVIVPDRLDDVLAAWLLIIEPCLATLAGARPARPSEVLPVASKLVSAPGFADLVLLRRTGTLQPLWEPIATGTLPWSASATADAYCLLNAEQEGFPQGTPLRGFLL